MANYNEVVHLVCGIKAKPAPETIIWYKKVNGNYTEINYNPEYYTCEDRCQKLHVTLNEYTIGDYKCRGCKNRYGCVTQTFPLLVSFLRKS